MISIGSPPAIDVAVQPSSTIGWPWYTTATPIGIGSPMSVVPSATVNPSPSAVPGGPAADGITGALVLVDRGRVADESPHALIARAMVPSSATTTIPVGRVTVHDLGMPVVPIPTKPPLARAHWYVVREAP